MKTFYIDFSGYLEVKAENKEQAMSKFWSDFINKISLTGDFSNDVWDIEGIEEKTLDK